MTRIFAENHPDPDVRSALIKLQDALCMWERSTGRKSVLVLKEQGGFSYRLADGIPMHTDDVSDGQFLSLIDDPIREGNCGKITDPG